MNRMNFDPMNFDLSCNPISFFFKYWLWCPKSQLIVFLKLFFTTISVTCLLQHFRKGNRTFAQQYILNYGPMFRTNWSSSVWFRISIEQSLEQGGIRTWVSRLRGRYFTITHYTNNFPIDEALNIHKYPVI